MINYLSLDQKSTALIEVHLQILKFGAGRGEENTPLTTYKVLADSITSIKCCCSKLTSYNTTIQQPITYTGIPITAYSELLNFTSEAWQCMTTQFSQVCTSYIKIFQEATNKSSSWLYPYHECKHLVVSYSVQDVEFFNYAFLCKFPWIMTLSNNKQNNQPAVSSIKHKKLI